MYIPPVWTKVSADERFPDGKEDPIFVWGCGEDEASAKSDGAKRLQHVLDRIRRGERFPDKYGYGNRPLREEILETIRSIPGSEPSAIVTRNGYGVEVLNTARLLFLDIDFKFPGLLDRIKQLFGGASVEDKAIVALRDTLDGYGKATFRLYRTAFGLRAMAIDRDFDPTAREVQDLMRSTGTDPAYARLCQAQKCFRARLTPKPWRCNAPPPPGQYPRLESASQQQFAGWIREYKKLSSGFVTCRYLETIGNGSPKGDAKELVRLHDRVTRCNEPLPLA
ncbi:MAG: hypothetical protein ACU843_04720 [Gammaproteobacteria bacterium]